MWPVSAAFSAQLLANSRQWSTRIEVLYGADIVTSLNVMVQGYTSIDNVAVRRECHFTIVDADGVLTPARATDLLSPKGTEIRIYRGLFLPSTGVYEYVPLGVYGIVQPEVRANEAGTQIEIKGFDRVDKLRALQFENPWPVADGTLVHAAIAAIMADRMPGVPMRVTPSAFTTPEVVFDRLSDPFDAIRTLAASCGYVMYFDQLGSAVIEPETFVNTGVTYDTGEQSLLMTSTAAWDASKTYSGVVLRGEHPNYPPIRYEKWDTDPASATYSLGPFGRRPYGMYSAVITTMAQAQAVADPVFARVTKMHQEIEIFTRGGPQHDVDDVIFVNDPRTKINDYYKVVSGTIPIMNVQGDHVRLRCQQVAP